MNFLSTSGYHIWTLFYNPTDEPLATLYASELNLFFSPICAQAQIEIKNEEFDMSSMSA